MNRRTQSQALRQAKAVPRELLQILQASVPVEVGRGRRLRSSRQLALPASVLQAQARAEEKYAEPVEEEKYAEEPLEEDVGEIDLGRQQDAPEDLFYRDLLARLRGIFARENEPGFLDLWDAERRRPFDENEKFGLSDDEITNQLAQLYENFPELREKVRRANEQLREREEEQQREKDEEEFNQEFQRKRGIWGRLDQQANRIARNSWLSGGVRVLNQEGINVQDPEGEPRSVIQGLSNVEKQLPAIKYVDKYNIDTKIKDWRRCGRCQWEDENGVQCSRYSSCHRDNPSNTYCWEHARMAGLTYQRRRGLV